MPKPAEEIEEEDTESVDLYNGSFSLAYGTLTLLRDAKMHLKRNRFYGLRGPNQCFKTTLRHAIANEQLEGFPKRDELKSVFVEHEIEDEEVGVQDDGFQILSVDKLGWWWVMHTCNEIYKLERRAEIGLEEVQARLEFLEHHAVLFQPEEFRGRLRTMEEHLQECLVGDRPAAGSGAPAGSCAQRSSGSSR